MCTFYKKKQKTKKRLVGKGVVIPVESQVAGFTASEAKAVKVIWNSGSNPHINVKVEYTGKPLPKIASFLDSSGKELLSMKVYKSMGKDKGKRLNLNPDVTKLDGLASLVLQ